MLKYGLIEARLDAWRPSAGTARSRAQWSLRSIYRTRAVSFTFKKILDRDEMKSSNSSSRWLSAFDKMMKTRKDLLWSLMREMGRGPKYGLNFICPKCVLTVWSSGSHWSADKGSHSALAARQDFATVAKASTPWLAVNFWPSNPFEARTHSKRSCFGDYDFRHFL